MEKENSKSTEGNSRGIMKFDLTAELAVQELENFTHNFTIAYAGITILMKLDERDGGLILEDLDPLAPIVMRDLQVLSSSRVSSELLHKLNLDNPIIFKFKKGSPGWLELLGKFKPLDFIAKIISIITKHREAMARQKAAEAEQNAMREERRFNMINEQETQIIKQETMRLDLIEKKIEILKKAGFSEIEIRTYVGSLIIYPVQMLAADDTRIMLNNHSKHE